MFHKNLNWKYVQIYSVQICANRFSSFDKGHFKLCINFMFLLTKQLKSGKTFKVRKLENLEKRPQKFN